MPTKPELLKEIAKLKKDHAEAVHLLEADCHDLKGDLVDEKLTVRTLDASIRKLRMSNQEFCDKLNERRHKAVAVVETVRQMKYPDIYVKDQYSPDMVPERQNASETSDEFRALLTILNLLWNK